MKVDCLFFSGHKFGAVYGSGFLLCSNEFYENFLSQNSAVTHPDENNESDENNKDTVSDDLAYNGTINYPAYLTTVSALQ